MICISNSNHEAALNLAEEEYLLSASGIREPMLFFYINDPSVIIGRHQNTEDEIDPDFIREHGIRVVRRCSGGGAVYHDRGNLNYSLIRPGDTNATSDFSVLLTPILRALRDLGIPAELSGRNDLTLNGAKFSGNAYYRNRFGSVIHGTLLFDSDLETLSAALRPHPEKIAAKGVRSVRSRVCCLKDVLPDIRNTEELREAILRRLSEYDPIPYAELTEEQKKSAEELAERKYRNDIWTYGESPAYTIRKVMHQPGGWIDFRADVREGTIRNARFFGDYFCTKEIGELETALNDVSWQPEAIAEALRSAGWDEYFPDFSLDSLLNELFQQLFP